MAEWLKAHAWKACIRATVSWVRIPLPPPGALITLNYSLDIFLQIGLAPIQPPIRKARVAGNTHEFPARCAKASQEHNDRRARLGSAARTPDFRTRLLRTLHIGAPIGRC